MRFRQFAPTVMLSILLILLSAPVCSGQADGRRGAPGVVDPLLTEARDLSEGGKFQEAAEAYTKWLAENGGHPDFGLILIEAADSQLSVERALELLRIYTPRVQDTGQRELCRASQIDLLEMLGRTEQALGLLRSFPPKPRWLYRQAQLLYQEGLTEEAANSLQQALTALLSDDTSEVDKNHDLKDELEARIRLLQARIFVVQERDTEAENLFRLLSLKYGDTALGPVILLAYYEYLLAQGRKDAADAQMEALARKFPGSPELALARGGQDRPDGGEGIIGYAPIPSRLLPRDPDLLGEGSGSDQGREQSGVQPAAEPEPQRTQQPTAQTVAPAAEPEPPRAQPPTAQTGAPARSSATAQTGAAPEAQPDPTALVQTGSFRDRENAEYMVGDLKAGGFAAEIVEKRIGDTLYFRVVIGPLMTVESAQAVLMQLKDAGFEGVLLFPE